MRPRNSSSSILQFRQTSSSSNIQYGDFRYFSLRITNTRSPAPSFFMNRVMLSPRPMPVRSRRIATPFCRAASHSSSTFALLSSFHA